MDPNTKIKFSRNGIEIGEYKLWEIEVMLKMGKILPTDHYWHAGMEGWSIVQKLIEQIEKAQKDKIEADKLRRDAETKNQDKVDFFNCNCCRHTFDEAEGALSRFGKGIGIVVLSSIISIYPLSFVSKSYISDGEKPLMVIFGFASVLLWLIGCGFILSAFVRAPSCPQCGSSNFAKPEKLSK